MAFQQGGIVGGLELSRAQRDLTMHRIYDLSMLARHPALALEAQVG